MLEQQIQAKIIKELKKRGCYVVKVITASTSGVPDILACCKGKFYGIEVKRPGNKPSALQIANMGMIVKAGGISFVAYSVEDLDEGRIGESEEVVGDA